MWKHAFYPNYYKSSQRFKQFPVTIHFYPDSQWNLLTLSEQNKNENTLVFISTRINILRIRCSKNIEFTKFDTYHDGTTISFQLFVSPFVPLWIGCHSLNGRSLKLRSTVPLI